MTDATTESGPGPPPLDAAPSAQHRIVRIAAWVGGTALAVFVLDLIGVPVDDWIRAFFHKLGQVPPWAVVSGAALETLQTTLAALVWLAILRAAFPRTPVPYRVVLAAYATAVALNDFLPANIGTLVMLVMLSALIAGATFAAMLSGLVVQKIPFSVFNIAVYLYLFLTVSGSFSIKLGFLSDHTGLVVLIAVGAIVLIAMLVRAFWSRTAKLRAELAAGGAILRRPRTAFVRLGAPALGSYLARLGIVAVFLGAYGIPVTFHNVASVTASNSISNSVSVTPGGVGVTQAMNTAALSSSTSASTATAYSISQQLVVTTWDILFAIVLVSWVFGWEGGQQLVRSSYDEAKVRSAELKRRRRAARSAGGETS
jgi:uncharacterized membrane protein YbhN (UPF0104 family)